MLRQLDLNIENGIRGFQAIRCQNWFIGIIKFLRSVLFTFLTKCTFIETIENFNSFVKRQTEYNLFYH